MLKYLEWLDELIKQPLQEKKIWIKNYLKDKKYLYIFGKFFFPHIIKGETEVPDCHIDLLEEFSKPDDSAIIFPRAHAKSTWEKIDTIHDIVYSIEPVILYVGVTLADAGFHLESIKSELENNELLLSIYGNLVPPESNFGRKWTNKHFQTINMVNVVARGAAKGRGVNIKNQRPTKIILDDIEDDEEVRSADRREKLHNWLYNVIFPSKDASRAKIKMIGTVLSPNCELLKFYKQHGGIFRKAVENDQPIWSEMFSIEKLMEIKNKIGTYAFSQEYLNTPINLETSLVPMNWIEPNFYQNIENESELMKIIMLDPQAGESKTADYYGLCVVGFKSGDRHRYLIERLEGKMSQIEQAALFVRTCQRHKHVLTAGVEKVLTQVAVYQILLEWIAKKIDLPNVNNDNRNIPLIAVEPEGKDKVARLQMHQAAFERGEIHLHSTQRAFAEKLTAFPDVEHDDDIDALIYCLEWANRSGVSFSQIQERLAQQLIGERPITAGLLNKKF